MTADTDLPAPAAPVAPPDGEEILRIDDLNVHFPVRGGLLDSLRGRSRGVVRAVDGIDLSFRRGEILALVGESGSGKTTTGRVITKLTRPTSGRMVFDGEDVSDVWGQRRLRRYRRRVQLIFQDPYETLNPKQTVRDFVIEPLDVNGIGTSSADREQRVLRALESAGLVPAADYALRYPHELSGGQRQRVVIAGALVMDPEFVVADEPVSMLDVSIRTELLRLMLDLRAVRGLTYLFITHDLSLAWVIADRIAVMYLGKIMEIGPAEQVIRSPQNPYTRALVSVSPTPEPPTAGERARRTILVGETPDAAHIPAGCRFNPRCPSAFDRCRVEEPPLIDVGEGQRSACWLADGGRRLPVLDAAPVVRAGRDHVAGSRGRAARRLTSRSVGSRRLGQDRARSPHEERIPPRATQHLDELQPVHRAIGCFADGHRAVPFEDDRDGRGRWVPCVPDKGRGDPARQLDAPHLAERDERDVCAGARRSREVRRRPAAPPRASDPSTRGDAHAPRHGYRAVPRTPPGGSRGRTSAADHRRGRRRRRQDPGRPGHRRSARPCGSPMA